MHNEKYFSECFQTSQSYSPVQIWRQLKPIKLQTNFYCVCPAKPLEKHINKHLLLHLDKYIFSIPASLVSEKKHPCQTALTSLVEQWLSNINNDEFNGVIFVDFKKAFDVIDHNLLLRKLALYGMSDCVMRSLFVLS